MIKTQVQIPDELYHKAKQVAKERELSFAEVMRRGLEYITRTYPTNTVQLSDLKLPILEGDLFVAEFDELDLKKITADEETLRAFPND